MSMKGPRLSLNLPALPPIAKPAEGYPILPPIKDNNNKDNSRDNNEIKDYHNESDIHEDILIKFTLPSGEQVEQMVKSGETVQELKRRLHANHNIPFSSSSLFFKGKCMLDPLSLNDIAGVVDNSGVALIEVKVKDPVVGAADGTRTEDTKHKDAGHEHHGNGTMEKDSSENKSQHQPPQHKHEDLEHQQGNGRDEHRLTPPPSKSDSNSTGPSSTSPPSSSGPSSTSAEGMPSYVQQPTLNSIVEQENPPPSIPSLPLHSSLVMDESELPPAQPTDKTTPRNNNQQQAQQGDTAINVGGDDDGDVGKEIETLGGKKWKFCCFLV